MKIWCDVCDKEEASVFCSADEAALCDGCDRRVHYANKLASKHLRFSLVNPTYKESPLCDICQERRALLFCQEDRAILCRECDLPIHQANEHTQKHNRFLLTGVKLSGSSSLYPIASSFISSSSSAAIETEPKNARSSLKRPSSVSNEIFSSPSSDKTLPATANYKVDDNHTSDAGSISTSSITEYLMETIPGWRVEDLLDPSYASNGFCKTFDHLLPYVDQDLESSMTSFPSEDLAISVPQVCSQAPQLPLCLPQNGSMEPKAADTLKVMKKWSDHGHAVPQISPSALKKSRDFW